MAEKSEIVKNKSKILNNEDLKKEDPTRTEIPPVKFARIVFDATDMDKGFHTMRLNAASPMREIKKLFPKHLEATEDTFMLYFNNWEVENETPLQLFHNDLEGDDNVILIVKSIKIRLGGHGFLKEKRQFLDERPNMQFSVIRQKIAAHLMESSALIGLLYNGQEILNDQTPESVKMEHGDFLKVIKKDGMKIRLRGSIFDAFCGNQCIELDPHITTMKKIKSVISRHVKEDESKFMLIYNGQELCDQDTPLDLGMSDTDILIANFKFDETKKIKDPMAENEEFSYSEDSFASEDASEDQDDIYEKIKKALQKDAFNKKFEKAFQMYKNKEKRKEKINGGFCLAKDMQNHKDFENVDDILKFIGEEDSNSNTSKKNNEQVESSKRSKRKNKKGIKMPTPNHESDKKVDTVDKLDMQDCNGDDFEEEVSSVENYITDNKQNEILDIPNEDRKDPRSKLSKNGKNKIDPDSDGANSIENEKDFENLKDILDFIGDADEEELEEIKCLIGKLKSKQAALESEAEAKEEQLEDDRMPESDGQKYLLQEKHECQYEQEIDVPAKRGEEKVALFVKQEPIQEEDVANHVLLSKFENGQHEVKEVKKDCGENGQCEINEVTKDGIKQKKKKVKKPYCARGSCPNKGGHKCSRCKAVFYCHQDCLKEDWPHHKMFCDYVYEANKVPDDSTSKNPSEIEDTGTREDVD